MVNFSSNNIVTGWHAIYKVSGLLLTHLDLWLACTPSSLGLIQVTIMHTHNTATRAQPTWQFTVSLSGLEMRPELETASLDGAIATLET